MVHSGQVGVYITVLFHFFPSSFRIPLSLIWANRTVPLTVHWFQRESDPERNSNVYEVAQKAVNDNFPGESAPLAC